MIPILRRLLPLLFLPLLLQPAVAWPQASVNVSASDPVYRDIDKLVAHGLIKKIVMGQRPFSRREIARLTKEAMYYWQTKKETASAGNVSYIETILDRLKKNYAEELVQLDALPGEKRAVSAHLIEKAELDLTMTNSPAEAIPPVNPLGQIDAVINPLLDYRQGRHLVQGVNLGLETNHWLRASNHFAMLFRSRFQIGEGPANDENRFDVLNLYGKFLIKNFEVEIGRDNLFYGQGKDAGLLLSNNPRGLDMIKISNDEPFFFPWVFKYMGAQKLSFFFSDLGPEQFFKNSYLVGYKWSMEVNSFFEFGLFLATMSGGDGSPAASFGERVEDIFPFGQVTGSDQVQIGNKFAGFDLRFRIPPARGMELYLEFVADDYHDIFDSSQKLKKTFVYDAGYVAGLYLPRVDSAGKVDFRLEYHQTGLRYYRHGQFQGGWTLNRFLIGDNLGPNGRALYATVNWDVNPQNIVSFNGAYEFRSNDIWQVEDPDFTFVKIQDNPDEKRYRFVGGWTHRMEDLPVTLLASLGYERVSNFGWVQGVGRNNVLGQVQFQINLDRWTHFPK